MKRVALVFLLAAMCASAPVTLTAQRGGGSAGGGRGGGHAQRKPPSAPVARPTPNRPPPAAPDINRPSFVLDGLNRPAMPPAGLLGITPPARSPFDARPRTYTARGPRQFGIPLGGYGLGAPGYYGGGLTGYGDSYPDNYSAPSPGTYSGPYSAAPPARPAIDETSGLLFLDATPRGAQVFIDSAYVGTVDDLFANGVTLTRGRHWVELEAPEYEKKLVEVNIAPGRAVRYRADLAPARRAALTVIPPRPPETMYAIPGCYGGNKPPVVSALPAGCNMANLRVLRPQRTN